jgi:hypothetical protein
LLERGGARRLAGQQAASIEIFRITTPDKANVMERAFIARHGLPPVGPMDRLFQWLAVRQIQHEAARVNPDFTPRPVDIGA